MNNSEQPSERARTAQSSPAQPAWRTEPEIARERQQFLRQRLAIVPDIHRGIYPFKDVALTRADIEWLLITHEQGQGPVEWSDPAQRERQGLDLRGANLRQVNGRGLPLARVWRVDPGRVGRGNAGTTGAGGSPPGTGRPQ